MKRIAVIALLVVVMLLPLSVAHADINTRLNGEGLAPYALTPDEAELLSAFGLAGNAHVLAFRAPPEAHSVILNVYSMDEAGKWSPDGGGSIVGIEGEPLDGLFTMIIRPDSSMELRIVNEGTSTFTAVPLEHFDDYTASSIGFLQEPKAIELENEIPVAMMVYDNGTSLASFELDDFFAPEHFEGMDAVRVVTLTFSENQ